MNTDMDVAYLGCPDILDLEDQVRDWFEFAEERFSRFRPQSELSYLNRSAGRICMVSGTMLEVLGLAESYRKRTDGMFNPFILKALKAAGYDATFDQVRQREDHWNTSEPDSTSMDETWELDAAMKSVRLRPQAEIDLGGIVKGWAVSRLARWMREVWAVPCGMVNAGGDLAVWGASHRDKEQSWLIGIQNPWNPGEDAGVLHLGEGAAATSSTLGRQWLTHGSVMHHLIDPRTMSPSRSDVVQCTVAGSDTVECEIWAKTMCIAGLEHGLSLFRAEAAGCEALVFLRDGRIHFIGANASPAVRWQLPTATLRH
ncbi:FAD:protein FMN transferase [Paenibacillus tyrfis]|uniref:FAD:protein FMN transferase n=1 Tax=Paenibacillus tyrfis TaxID=1501230 RepID=UPI00209D2D2E|nr:FAD:protein FMN transferase [Paenibacillus tyrfis]MCP1310242.1 FAD:protein FMN transferase [Paenibacillus tyrfis]